MASTMTHGEALAELGLGLTFSLDDMKAAYRKTAMTWSPSFLPPFPYNNPPPPSKC